MRGREVDDAILRLLQEHQSVRLSEVQRLLGVHPKQVQRAVKRLEEIGLITRTYQTGSVGGAHYITMRDGSELEVELDPVARQDGTVYVSSASVDVPLIAANDVLIIDEGQTVYRCHVEEVVQTDFGETYRISIGDPLVP